MRTFQKSHSDGKRNIKKANVSIKRAEALNSGQEMTEPVKVIKKIKPELGLKKTIEYLKKVKIKRLRKK